MTTVMTDDRGRARRAPRRKAPAAPSFATLALGPFETEPVGSVDVGGDKLHDVAKGYRGYDPTRPPNAGRPFAIVALEWLHKVCEDADVQLGAHDERMLEWLAGWDSSTVQTIGALIARAGAR